MPVEGDDGLASVAEMLAGLTAAARAGGLDDTAALTALAAARRIAPGLRRTQGSVRPMQDEHPSVRYPDPSVRLNSGESRGWTYIGTDRTLRRFGWVSWAIIKVKKLFKTRLKTWITFKQQLHFVWITG